MFVWCFMLVRSAFLEPFWSRRKSLMRQNQNCMYSRSPRKQTPSKREKKTVHNLCYALTRIVLVLWGATWAARKRWPVKGDCPACNMQNGNVKIPPFLSHPWKQAHQKGLWSPEHRYEQNFKVKDCYTLLYGYAECCLNVVSYPHELVTL